MGGEEAPARQYASRRLELKTTPFFYGWVQVWVTVIAGAFSSGAGFWAFTVFVTPMGDDLGWSRPELYAAMTVRALGNALLAPFIGPLQDSRVGPRVFAIGTAVTMAASMILLKWVDDLLLFYIVFGLIGSLANFGSSEMMLSVVLPRWFVRQRGRALGIGSMGTALGPLLFPFLVTGLLTVFDWRDAWFALGVITLVVLLPVSLLVRSRPEDMGLTPDGDAAGALPSAAIANAPSEHDFTRGEAVRQRAFWLIVFAASLTTLGTNGFHSNWLPFFQDEGFSAAEGSLAATVYGICSLTTRVFWGWGAERASLRHLMALQAALTALSVLAFLLIDSRVALVLAAAFNGLALGGVFIMRPMIVATYFGRGHLGAINGLMRPFMTAASAFSPLLVAWVFEARGSYDAAIWLLGACWLVAALTVLLASRPTRADARLSPAATGTG